MTVLFLFSMGFVAVFYIVVLVLLLTFVYAGVSGAPWVPTRGADVERFLKLSNLKSAQKMYDLGSGDGRLVCAAANYGVKAVGFEISFFPYVLSRFRYLFCKNKKNCSFACKSFWKADLRDADVVYFFLMPKVYPKLKKKLERELRKGAKVVAYVWPFEGWEPFAVDKKKGAAALYLYKI